MKNSIFLSESAIAAILIFLLILFLNPFNLLMPPPFLSMLTIFLIAAFGLFVALVWKENAADERETFHRMLAGRIAFLAGSAVLVAGIIIQSLKHDLDPWLVFAFGAMILAKIIGLLYGRIKY